MKLKACRVCKAPFKPRASTQVACSVECAIGLARKKRAKAESAGLRADRKIIKLRLENLKTRSDYLKEAQHAFNAFIRERDKQAGHPCISSGRPLDWTGNNVDAGHYRSTGSAPHLRFDERNCHAQSKHDNRYLAGNAVDYRIGLIERIGMEAVEALEADQTPKHYSKDELRAIRDHYRAKLKDMKR